MFMYFDALHPVADVDERLLRRHIVHDDDAVCFAQILLGDAAIFFLPCW